MAVKKTEARPARKAPDMTGVPGKLVEMPTGEAIAWGTRNRKSPYDPMLRNLIDAGPGKALQFGDARAWVSVSHRAKKLGIKVEPGFADGVLYVRLVATSDRDVRHEKVLAALKSGPPANEFEIARVVNMDAPMVRAILMQESKAGKCLLGPDAKWRLTA